MDFFLHHFFILAKYETLHWYFGVFFSLGYHMIEEGSLFDHGMDFVIWVKKEN